MCVSLFLRSFYIYWVSIFIMQCSEKMLVSTGCIVKALHAAWHAKSTCDDLTFRSKLPSNRNTKFLLTSDMMIIAVKMIFVKKE